MHPNMFDYYNTIIPLTLPPSYFGVCPQNFPVDIYTKRTMSLQNRIPQVFLSTLQLHDLQL